MNIDKQAIARLMGQIQGEFDKHSIRVPIEADTSSVLPQPTTVNNYNGPTVVMTGQGAQAVAWNSGTVTQGQQNVSEIAPGYVELADLLTKMLASIETFELPEDDAAIVAAEIDAALTEVTNAEPDPGRIKRAVLLIKGALVSGIGRATSDESAKLAHKVIEQLGDLVT